MGVERPLGHRVPLDGEEVAAVLGLGPGAQRALVLGGEVGLVGVRADEGEGLGEVQHRQLLGHLRHRGAGPLDGVGRVLVDPGDHPGEDLAQHREHVAVVADEAELDVERDVLRQVPHGVVRLGAEDRPDLVDPLEDADQLLLVELRALGEVRRPAEVVDREDVGAALGRGLDELRGVDLGEAEAVEGAAEAAQAGRGELPLRALGRMPPGDGGVVELRGQAGGEARAPELERRRLAPVRSARSRSPRSPRPRRVPARWAWRCRSR